MLNSVETSSSLLELGPPLHDLHEERRLLLLLSGVLSATSCLLHYLVDVVTDALLLLAVDKDVIVFV